MRSVYLRESSLHPVPRQDKPPQSRQSRLVQPVHALQAVTAEVKLKQLQQGQNRQPRESVGGEVEFLEGAESAAGETRDVGKGVVGELGLSQLGEVELGEPASDGVVGKVELLEGGQLPLLNA